MRAVKPKLAGSAGSAGVGEQLCGCFPVALVNHQPRAARQIERIGTAGIVGCHPRRDPCGGEQALRRLCL